MPNNQLCIHISTPELLAKILTSIGLHQDTSDTQPKPPRSYRPLQSRRWDAKVFLRKLRSNHGRMQSSSHLLPSLFQHFTTTKSNQQSKEMRSSSHLSLTNLINNPKRPVNQMESVNNFFQYPKHIAHP